MDLGISSLGYIIEYGLSKKYKSLSDLIFKATEDCLKFAEQETINVVELVLDPPEIFKEEYKQNYIDLVNDYTINKQVHGPFINVNLCTHNNSISSASVDTYLKSADICNAIGTSLLTIHPGLANFLINSIWDYNKLQLARAISDLLSYTKDLNVDICLENMPQNCNIMLDENDIEDTFLKINRTDLYITYDTSHFYTCDGNVEALWDKFHKVIKNVHIVDNFSKDSDTHPPIGTGQVNFNEIFEVINRYNYNGPFIIELSSTKELISSIEYVKTFF